ncbi:glycosyltransferase [Mesobaculum littorinae]|uniref:Glycosyltransferase n=1 Tax=Mesobaculum littorinae TaxID=2486419 RepID=A0A438AD92_9RHOB|nr:glycosyltransferase [Mesobaculum littorinae]RVV96666.1 glycosyltransferase [Mesobaculum littorinae]
MKFLFLHQNFPGQFKHLAPALVQAGHEVFALTSRFEQSQTWRGVRIIAYRWSEPEAQRHHAWLGLMNRAVHRGEVCLRALQSLKARGLQPDAIIAHSGWGEALFVRDVFPDTPLGIFSELYYRAEGSDIDFDPEFQTGQEFGRSARIRMRNLAMRMQLESADRGISPTRFQADTHPPDLRDRIDVIHDGIDTDAIRPAADAVYDHDSLRLTRDDEVVTFVNRNLEPYRGYHSFMRALPALLKARPRARVMIVGSDGVSYGAAPKDGRSWKQVFLDEVRPQIPQEDWARVHFVGQLPYGAFLSLLQVSTVHVYLTYPFVLSWSLMEAMAAECAIVASDTAPVREVIEDGQTGVLVDFFDPAAIADQIARLAADPERRAALGRAARQRIVERYDLSRVCLPQHFAWVERLAASGPARNGTA